MSPLYAPWTFRSGARLSNRVVLAPLTNQQSADDGTLSDDERRWLLRRARGGFSMISTCASHVTREGKGFDRQLGIHDDALLPGLTSLAEGIGAAGALGIVQLYHGGVRSPSRLTGVQPVSAGVFTEEREGFEVPRALPDAEVQGVLEAFVAAAHRARRAGFSGVELHAAHGYLLSQFLSTTMNLRDDAWGGDPERRMKLVRTLARRVRREIPAPFVVGVRLSPEDYGLARGIDLDETIALAAGLADDGVDYVHLSLWDAARNTKKRPDQHAVPAFRAVVPRDVALFAAGGVYTREDAERLLDLGADVVALGRAAILDPDWPLHAKDPAFVPRRGPLTRDELAAVEVSGVFATYLERFKGMVATATV